MSLYANSDAAYAVAQLRMIRDTLRADVERQHADADAALLHLLRALGYHEVCDLYEAMQPEWWYA